MNWDILTHVKNERGRRGEMSQEDLDFEKEKIEKYESDIVFKNIPRNCAQYLLDEYDLTLLDLDKFIKQHYPERIL